MPNNLPKNLLRKSLDLLMKRQTSILSAAFIIMSTVILSLLLGLVKKRLLISLFGPALTGAFDISSKFPDFLFQLVFASAISTAFIPVFSDYLAKDEEKEAHKVASIMLSLGMLIFAVLAVILFLFAPYFIQIFNLGQQNTAADMQLMAELMRIIAFGQLLFIIGIFFTALLQSYNHFFIPGIALALYNLGIIIGMLSLHSVIGIYSAAVGTIIGSVLFIFVQLPLVRKIGFSFKPLVTLKNEGVRRIAALMWPRAISNGINQLGVLMTASLVSYLSNPLRNYTIFDLAQTLAFAPVSLVGQAIAQAAFPILSKERDRLENFKTTFVMSFNQMLYLVLPISILLLFLRIPVVRLVFGAKKFDWPATVLTGQTLAFFTVSIFAQALLTLVYRAFYALHDAKTPLIANAATTIIMVVLSFTLIVPLHQGVESLAISSSIASIGQLVVLMVLLDRKTKGFNKISLVNSWIKIAGASFFTAFAIYIPLKLLDQIVIDTTHTVGLIVITGISTIAGLSLYLFLSWFFEVQEAKTYILAIRKIGNWQEVVKKMDEVIGREK